MLWKNEPKHNDLKSTPDAYSSDEKMTLSLNGDENLGGESIIKAL